MLAKIKAAAADSVGYGGETAGLGEDTLASGGAEADIGGGGPAFPTLGVTLDFLERFTREHVSGKLSRYCTARVDCDAGADDELSFKKGEILAIGDLNAINDGWFVGYRRAGNWADRKKFRVGAVDRLAGLSTDEVCANIIKPVCAAASWPEHEQERSYARMMRAQGDAGIGTATVFASHAWTFVFEQLIESLRFFEAQKIAAGGAPSFFWLDIFVVDENQAHTYPSEWWQTSFTEAVREIGHTALVLTPWSAPVPLRRAWCLWEIYSTLSTEAELSVTMSNSENVAFHRALLEDVDAVVTALCTIDAETAEAGSPSDLEMIFAAVRSLDGGFQTLNATVMEKMRSWLMDSMVRELAALGLRFEPLPVDYRYCCAVSDDDKDDWPSAFQPLFLKGCGCDDDGEDTRLSFGNWYRTGAGTKDDASICAAHYGELSFMQKRRWKAIKEVADLGKDAELFSERRYGLVGEIQGGDQAEATAASLLLAGTRLACEVSAIDSIAWDETEAARKAVRLRTKLYGECDVRTSTAMLELSRSIDVQDDEEYELLIKGLEIRNKLLPANDPLIGNSLHFIGRFFASNCDDHKAAVPFFQKALAIFEHHDPECKTSDTLSSVNELACSLEEEGRLDEARLYYERNFELNLKWMGDRHLETSACANNLALLILSDFSDETFAAVPLLRLNLKIVEVAMGVDVVDTAEGRRSLGECLLDCIDLTKRDSSFRVGDRIRLMDDLATNKQLAKKHGGWGDDMDKLCGTMGTVNRIDVKGDLKVLFDTARRAAIVNRGKRGRRGDYRINPAACTLVERPAESVHSDPGLAQVPCKLSMLMPEGWGGTEEEAEQKVEEEAEALLLRALCVLEAEVGSFDATGSSARAAAGRLCDLYEKHGRKKEVKTMRKQKEALEGWCSESEDDDTESDSDSSEDESDEDAGREGEVQDLLLTRSPQFARALEHGNDEAVTVADLESALASLHAINAERPPTSKRATRDRAYTEKALVEKLKVARRRDRAYALLTPAKDDDGGELNHTVSGLLRRLPAPVAVAVAVADPAAAVVATIPEGTPPPSHRHTPSAANADELAPGRIDQSEAEPEPEAEPQLEPQPTAMLEDLTNNLAALSVAVEAVAKPTHAFGRAATTGIAAGSVEELEDRKFDTLLESLGLQAYAVALRAQAIVTGDELRDLTESEMESLRMAPDERARVVSWAAGLA
jgi:tetratricopeptide (TPR) repeat protein